MNNHHTKIILDRNELFKSIRAKKRIEETKKFGGVLSKPMTWSKIKKKKRAQKKRSLNNKTTKDMEQEKKINAPKQY